MSRKNEFDFERWRRAWPAPSPEAGAARAACASDDEIWRASRGELPGQRVEELLEHARQCAHCELSWRMAASIAREAGASGRPVSRRLWAVAALATAAAFVGVVLLLPRIDRETTPSYRATDQEEHRPQALSAPRLPRDDFRLRWSPGPAGSIYHVEVATEDLAILDMARGLAIAEYQVPAGKLAALPRETKLLWRVEVLRPDGSRSWSSTFAASVD